MISNTGATGHYIKPTNTKHCIDIITTNSGPSVQITNDSNTETDLQAKIPLSKKLSNKSTNTQIFENLSPDSLISKIQMCYNDCIDLLSTYHVKMIKDGKVIIGGQRDNTKGLWNNPLDKKDIQTTNNPPPNSTKSKPTIHHTNVMIKSSTTKQ